MTADAVGASIVANVERVLLGKGEQVRIVVAALLASGHVLIEDAPGVGKTLLAKAVARSIGGTVGRVQGTADLLPADITGVTIFDQERRDWDFRPGPLFNHVLLVDEINRATPRAQSALLEAMAEGHVTVDGSQHDLPEPFLVLATQNPFGDAGTFPLIAGEYDRFAVSVSFGLPGSGGRARVAPRNGRARRARGARGGDRPDRPRALPTRGRIAARLVGGGGLRARHRRGDAEQSLGLDS